VSVIAPCTRLDPGYAYTARVASVRCLMDTPL